MGIAPLTKKQYLCTRKVTATTMKRMKLYEADDKMIDLISDNYSMLQGLGAFGIRLGFGDKTVTEVCREQDVDCHTFLTVVNFLINGYTPKETDDRISVATLLAYLRASHHYFLDFQLPSIRKKLEASLTMGDNRAELILRLYDEYAHDIRLHMKYEEKTLFPYVEALMQGEQKPNYNVDTFAKHHSDTTGKFQELKNIIIKYLPHDGLANNQLTTTLYDIYNNEEWLRLRERRPSRKERRRSSFASCRACRTRRSPASSSSPSTPSSHTAATSCGNYRYTPSQDSPSTPSQTTSSTARSSTTGRSDGAQSQWRFLMMLKALVSSMLRRLAKPLSMLIAPLTTSYTSSLQK